MGVAVNSPSQIPRISSSEVSRKRPSIKRLLVYPSSALPKLFAPAQPFDIVSAAPAQQFGSVSPAPAQPFCRLPLIQYFD
ncbi:hypothetical protein CEXT_760121 [Caerostris extrusa]|uniref:Uncharacterized protein n=1 Tax=Caerostris extrusa TaxID=172846 RepID=A0AAV4MYL6_CAEEX|nr:hypothetical protein CEXT_760121 [Caerostris extrusa]